MNCSQIRKMISPYVDDELRPADRKILLSHAEECDLCRQELTDAERVHHLFIRAERYEAPYGFTQRVIARVAEADSHLPWLVRASRAEPFFAYAAKATFALIVVAVGIISGRALVADRTVERQAAVQDSFSLDLFQATPPGSITGIYASLLRGDQ